MISHRGMCRGLCSAAVTGTPESEKRQLVVDIETSYGNGKTAASDQGRVK
ncbi:hypothetical protein GCM10010327_29660 [Streptomyces nitrosporeus]|nr:hypothetical protein GCM10010327_29660 [Streptomyces nitrosporeus]